MYRNILACSLLLCIISCTQSNKIEFKYVQKFNPESSAIKDQTTRLVFNDVREETRLSSWGKANWQLTDNGVKVVGSRRDEFIKREKAVKDVYEGQESFVMIREFRVPWLTLSMGNSNWCDYSVSTTLKFDKSCTAGVAFRYLNSREYYAFMLYDETNKVSLVLRRMAMEATSDHLVWDELKTTDYKFTQGKTYNLNVQVKDSKIKCLIDDLTVINFEDKSLKSGKVALIADDKVTFGPVTVEGEMLWVKPVNPEKFTQPELVYDLPLKGENIERDFYFLDPDSDGENEIIIAEKSAEKCAYRCLEFDRTELWSIENIKYPTTEGGDFAIQVFDINGDGKNEVIVAIDFQIQVRNGKTGKIINKVSTPTPNPYFDSRDYKYPKLLGDAICPVKIFKDRPKGFYIKDRYTNIWMYDNNLNLLWHKAMSTSHFPVPLDLNGDGRDEILINHTMLDANGSVIWEIPLSDHVDNISYASLNPGKEPKFLYLAGGEMGLIKVEPTNGEILKQLQLGHIQTITIADFVQEKEGLELLTQTLWREDQIHYLLDKDLNLISTWQGEFGRIYPLPWGENGKELALTTNGIVDPITGQVLKPSFGRIVDVLSNDKWGNVLVFTEEENHLRAYAPTDLKVKQKPFWFDDIQSHYLPIVVESSM